MNVLEVEQGTNVLPPTNDSNLFTAFTFSLSTAGILLSATTVILLILTAILFKEWRESYKNQLLIQFMIARFIYTFVRYFYDVKRVFGFCVRHDCIIYLDQFSMVYTEATLISWMFVFTKQMYDSLVKVFAIEKPNIIKVSLLTWILPGIVSVILYCLFYLQNDSDFQYFYMYILLVKWPVLIGTAVLLIIILRSVMKTNKNSAGKNSRIVFVMILLICMFCVQQLILDGYKIAYVIVLYRYSLSTYVLLIGNIFLMYHCPFSIIFWVFGNAKTRLLWMQRFKRRNLIEKVNPPLSDNSARTLD